MKIYLLRLDDARCLFYSEDQGPANAEKESRAPRRGLRAFIDSTGADELMVTAQIFDHEARKRSFEILAGVHRELATTA